MVMPVGGTGSESGDRGRLGSRMYGGGSIQGQLGLDKGRRSNFRVILYSSRGRLPDKVSSTRWAVPRELIKGPDRVDLWESNHGGAPDGWRRGSRVHA